MILHNRETSYGVHGSCTAPEGAETAPVWKSKYTPGADAIKNRLLKLSKDAGFSTRTLAKALNAHPTQVFRVATGDTSVTLLQFVSWVETCGGDPVEELRLLLAFLRVREGKAKAESAGARGTRKTAGPAKPVSRRRTKDAGRRRRP